jgi:hypothetical protein
MVIIILIDFTLFRQVRYIAIWAHIIHKYMRVPPHKSLNSASKRKLPNKNYILYVPIKDYTI